MRQVRLHFSLVGNTKQFFGSLPKEEVRNIKNVVILDLIKEQVQSYFGKRACIVNNHASIELNMQYPECYAAGWFVSDDGNNHGTDLVVIAHGDTMEVAQQAVMDTVRSTDWDDVASSY
jgi:hypothetical protein